VTILAPDPRRLLALPRERRERYLSLLAPEEREVAERAIEDATPWRFTPVTMAHHLTHGRFKLWAYAVYLGEKFRQAVTGESPRQIWNVAPRYGKSTWASQWGPAWALDRNPAFKLLLTSYGDDLARDNAIAVRDVCLSYPELRVRLRQDRRRADRFVTSEGGGLLARGIMSSITGYGADGAVVDDPYKGWQEAHSRLVRQRVSNQFRSVIRPRLESERAFLIVVHTRWHEEDLTAELTDVVQDATGDPFELVRIPELAEPFEPSSLDHFLRAPDPLGRRPGEVLEPERFSERAVHARRVTLGDYLTAALLQQRPAPAAGSIFKRDWWQLDLEERFSGEADSWLSSWDFKLKERAGGDYTVGQAWARTGRDLWLVDQLRGHFDQAQTANAMALLQVRHPRCRRHLFENTGYGPEVANALRTAFPGYTVSDETRSSLGMTVEETAAVEQIRRAGLGGLIPVNPRGSKEVRARAVVPYIEAADVHLPAKARWLPAFLEEMSAFGGGAAHDDQVDAMSQALARLHKVGKGGGRGFGEELRSTRATIGPTPVTALGQVGGLG